MACKRCSSVKLKAFNGEIAIHFRGIEGLSKPIVWVFPEVLVCLECGMSDFTIPKRELDVLVTGSPLEGAVVFDSHEEIAA